MADRPRLDAPVIRVVLADGSEHTVQCENRDMVAFDLQRAPRKWPGPDTAPILYQTFIAWKALTREALVDPRMPWDTFVGEAISISSKRPDGAEDSADVDPSPPGPGPG